MWNIHTMIRTSRKEHRCTTCGGRIYKGDDYCHSKFLYDGKFHEMKNHLECKEVIDYYYDKGKLPDYGDGISLDTLRELVEDDFKKHDEIWDMGFGETFALRINFLATILHLEGGL